MIDSLQNLKAGVTRVKSLKTGSVGTIMRLLEEAKREARFDAIEIAWDSGKHSQVFLMQTDYVELLDAEEEALAHLVAERRAQQAQAIEVDIDKI